MKKYILTLTLLLLLAPLGALAEPLNVFVSIQPQKFFLDQIGKNKVKVSVLVPPGASPEVYEPKPSQMVDLAKTDIYFAIGMPFETAWLPKIQSSNSNMLIVHTDANVPKIPIDGHNHYDDEGNIIEHHHEGEVMDPHIWLSPALVKIQGRNIADGLISFDPENAAFYEANLRDFYQRVDQVDAQVREKLKGLEGITFMTFHPAWGYFAQAFGLHQLTVEVGGREPSPAQLKEIMEQAKAADVKVIFVQPQLDSKHARTIKKALRIKLLIADPLELDWSMCLLQQANRIYRMY